MNNKNNIEDIYPLSPVQRGILFHTLYSPQSGVYLIQLSSVLSRDLDISALKQAWQKVIERHTVLRTAFKWERRDDPLQIALRQVDLPWSEIDLCDLLPAEQQSWMADFLIKDREIGFNLSQAPLLRLTVIVTADRARRLIWTYHHIILDGWSRQLILKEVFTYYEAYSRGYEVKSDSPRLYKDYVVWLRQQDRSAAKVFWRRQLKGFTIPANIDLNRLKPSVDSKNENHLMSEVWLSAETTSELELFARKNLLTLNTVVQAAWLLLLSNYNKQNDVVCGIHTSGRHVSLAGIESMVGVFVNTIPLRVHVSLETSLLTWMKALQEQQLEIGEYEYASLVDVQAWGEELGGRPLFETIFVFENYPRQQQSFCSWSGETYIKEQSSYPLTLLAVPGRELLLAMEYEERRYVGEDISTLLYQLKVLLCEMPIASSQPIANLSFMEEKERHQLFFDCDDTNTECYEDKTLPNQKLRNSLSTALLPQTPTEEILATIWAEIPDLIQAGIHGNFFELKGNSLTAMLLIAKVNMAFQTDLELRTIFEHPTLAGLAARIDESRRRGRGIQVPLIKPVPRDGQTPVSFSQQRLWFLDQLLPGGSLYNIPVLIRLTGRPDISALERSFNQITRRHDQPVGIIHTGRICRLSVIDLRALEPLKREPELRRLVREEARRPFDLGSYPLFRTGLWRLEEDEHVLLLTIHHIICDAWSIKVFLREMTTLYEKNLEGQESDLPPLPIQYADYAQRQREWIAGETAGTHLEYWRKQLGEDLPVFELPGDRPRPAVQTNEGASEPVRIPAELSAELKVLSRREKATMFMTLLTAFEILLHRYTGQDEIVIGTPVANRNRIETAGLIGLFVNTLVMRVALSGNPTFQEALGQIRETALSAYTYQDLPFERLVEELRPQRDLSHNPLFQILFAYNNTPQAELKVKGLRLRPMEVETGSAKLDLSLLLEETELGIGGTLEYNTCLYDRERMRRMGAHLITILEAVAVNPGLRIAEIPMLTTSERRQLLSEWNETEVEYGEERCIHELYQEQVRRTPEAIAVVCGDEQMSYRELNERANQLGNYLRKRGVGPEVRVGICLERSMEMVVGLLGILKAGGAYVPFDPGYPTQRLEMMIEDGKVKVLLLEKKTAEKVGVEKAEAVNLDEDGDEIGRMNREDCRSGVSGGNLGYVLFTSGSTGRPKGVAIEHRSAVELIRWAQEAYSREELSSVLASTSICFDLSVFELFAPLCTGGKTVVVKSAIETGDMIIEEEVKLINTVPSAITEMIRMETDLRNVSVVNLAGEALRRDVVENVYGKTGVNRVVNLYGPSEDTTYSTYAELIRGKREVPTIGKPISNTQIYILDKGGAPMPIGVTGEIYLGGKGTARGYLGESGQTPERFVPDPYGKAGGRRLYRTGDLGKWNENGEIEFLRRMDYQVKIRGYRIELGEVEMVLRRYPGVREAVVTMREDHPGEKYLAAYLVTDPAAPGLLSDLKLYLRAKLPEYMLPTAYVFLDSLPLTKTGKIDRVALLAPNRELTVEDYVPPRNEIEETVARVWKEVLEVERIGVHHNFFDLGGHSLTAVRVISQLRTISKTDLPLQQFFQTPTVAGLADILVEKRAFGQTGVISEVELLHRGNKGLDQLLTELDHLTEEEAQSTFIDETL